MTRVSVISPNSFITQHLQSNGIESTKGVAEFNEASGTTGRYVHVFVNRACATISASRGPHG